MVKRITKGFLRPACTDSVHFEWTNFDDPARKNKKVAKTKGQCGWDSRDVEFDQLYPSNVTFYDESTQ